LSRLTAPCIDMSKEVGDQQVGAAAPAGAEEDADYRAPAEKTIDEIVQADAEDEALRKYKAALLGSAVAGTGSVVAEPNDPR